MHDLHAAIVSLFWIAAASFLSPLLSRASGRRIPDVVLLLILGCIIGPSGFALASKGAGVEVVRELGLGLLFLLAGMEIDPQMLRGRQGVKATVTWVLCLLCALGITLLMVPDVSMETRMALGIALTSTALGTLLPILKERELIETPLGRAVLTHGAVGEVGPIVAMALLLGTRTPWAASAVLAAFAAAALLVGALPGHVRRHLPGIVSVIREGQDTTAQTGLRLVFLILLALMSLAAVFELDVVLGAFAAGFVMRELQPADSHDMVKRIETSAFAFFIPVFFVTSGMGIDLAAVADRPGLLVAIVLVILLARGVPVWLRERFTDTGSGLTDPADAWRLGLYAASGLPIIVAVTEVATHSGLLSADVSSILVAAGAVTVLVFPLLAGRKSRTSKR